MGKNVNSLEYVMFKAFHLAKKELYKPNKDKDLNCVVFGSVTFDAEMKNDEQRFDLTSKKFSRKDEAHMYADLRDKVYRSIRAMPK